MPDEDGAEVDADERSSQPGPWDSLSEFVVMVGILSIVVSLSMFFGGEFRSGFDQDGDGYSLWEEWKQGTSIWGLEPDGDGIPGTREDDGPWPEGKRLPFGEWADVVFEAVVVTDGAAKGSPAFERAMARAKDVLEPFGIALTYGVTWVEDSNATADSHVNPSQPEIREAAEAWSQWGDDAYVRQVFFVPGWIVMETGNGTEFVPGGAVGGTIFVSYHSTLQEGPFSSSLAETFVHELGHTLGLCHGHEQSCFQQYPIDEQQAVRGSLMSYADRPPLDDIEDLFSPTQVNVMHANVACMASQYPGSPPWHDADVWRVKWRGGTCVTPLDVNGSPSLSFSERLHGIGWGTGQVEFAGRPVEDVFWFGVWVVVGGLVVMANARFSKKVENQADD